MTDPKFVFLVSGQPGGQHEGKNKNIDRTLEDTFARVAWLRVRELVEIFNRDRKKAGAIVGINDEVHFVHFCAHTSKDKRYPRVEIYKHLFTNADDAPAYGSKAWVAFEEAGSFIEWQPIRDAKTIDPTKAVSIVNVYHSIRRAPAGSVLELSIFAHAFVEGPVLTNTDGSSNSPLRSTKDTDGRAATDFNDAMGEDPTVELGAYNGQPPPSGGQGPGGITAIKQFAAAFNEKATFRIWGCNIQDIVFAVAPGDTTPSRCLILSTARQVVEEAYKRPLKKGGMGGSALRATKLPPGTTMLQLNMGDQMADEVSLQPSDSFTAFNQSQLLAVHYNAIPNSFDTTSPNIRFFQPAAMGGTLQKTIQRSLSDVGKYVAQMMMTGYGFAAAAALPELTVFTGAPGTSSELSDTLQMHIAYYRLGEAHFFELLTGTPMNDDTSLVARHYTKLDAAAVTAIKAVGANGLP